MSKTAIRREVSRRVSRGTVRVSRTISKLDAASQRLSAARTKVRSR